MKVDGLMGDQLMLSTKPIDEADTKPLRLNAYSMPMYQFEGWNTKKDGTGTFYEDGGMVTISRDKENKGQLTLYAQWIPCYSVNGDTIKIAENREVEEIVIEDNSTNRYGFTSVVPITIKKFSYTRTMEEGCQWGTLCLPLELRSDAKAQYYMAGTVNGDVITLIPTDVVPGGTPCIFRIEDGSNTFHIEAENINFDGMERNIIPAEGNIQLFGTYDYQDFKCVGEQPYYAIQDNKFYNVASSMVVRPFRAYFRLKEIPSQARQIVFIDESGDPEASGIENVISEDVRITNIVDLSGRQQNTLKKGLNIIRYSDGRISKVYVK